MSFFNFEESDFCVYLYFMGLSRHDRTGRDFRLGTPKYVFDRHYFMDFPNEEMKSVLKSVLEGAKK